RPIAANGAEAKKTDRAPTEDKWPPGERNTRLASLAGKLRRNGLSPEAIEAALIAENELRCDPPLPVAKVRRIAASIARYPAGGDEPSRRRWAAQINVDNLPPDITFLNALEIFSGRVQF